MNVPAWLAVAALVMIPVVAGPARAQHGGHGGGASPHAAPPMSSRAMPPASSALDARLPDTTLARIFFSRGHRDIGMGEVRRAAAKLGVRPDSLTPQATGQVLGLLVQQAILTHRVHEEPRRWTASDSADYRSLRDRLTLSAAVDSALADMGFALAARGDSVPDRVVLGMMARDSAIARLEPVYDEVAVAVLAAAFASRPQPTSSMPLMERLRLIAQVPALAPADSARTIVTTRAGSVTAGRIVADFGRIPAIRRPPVNGADDVRALARNALFEQVLREAAARQNLAARPKIAAQLAERGDFLDLQEFVNRNVYDRVATDSATLRREFAAHRSRFRKPGQAVVVQVVSEIEAQADGMAQRLRTPGFAESLATRSAAAGAPYQLTLDEPADTALFARLRRAGEGAVLGPDSVSAGWRVLKVMRLVDRHESTFDEAYADVRADWRERDGERRMREMMQKLGQSAIIRTNDTSPYLTGRRRDSR